MASNDISDEYRRVMVEGLENLGKEVGLPKLDIVLTEAAKEIRLLDAEVNRLKELLLEHKMYNHHTD